MYNVNTNNWKFSIIQWFLCPNYNVYNSNTNTDILNNSKWFLSPTYNVYNNLNINTSFRNSQ